MIARFASLVSQDGRVGLEKKKISTRLLEVSEPNDSLEFYA